MCCEDLKIHFSKRCDVRSFVPVLVSQAWLGPSPYRWSILIPAPLSGSLYIMCDNIPGTGHGFTLSAGSVPFYQDREMIGDALGKPWWIAHSAGGITCWILETLVLPDQPCKGLFHGEQSYIIPTTSGGKLTGTEVAKRIASGN
jgi:hypothetical protein